MKYVFGIVLGILGFICLFFPEIPTNQNAFNAVICYILAMVCFDYKREEK